MTNNELTTQIKRYTERKTYYLPFIIKYFYMENTTAKIPVMIYTESTPNPNTLKFVTNKALLLNDMVEFQSVEETENAPLAKALFDFDGVTNVFITNNFVTITKQEELLWTEIMIPIKDFLKKYLDENNTILSENFVKPTKTATNAISDDDSDVDIRIKSALDKYENQL